jgi:opacity protein-like surface antigen
MKLKFVAALLASSAIAISAPAYAQESVAQIEPTDPDQSDAAADATITQAATLDDAQAKLEMLQAQVEALQASIDQMKKESVQETPAWKDMGWSSKTKISGKAFFNVSNIGQSHTDLLGNKTDDIQEGTQTELKRFYIGIDHKFNDIFSANLTTDFRYNANGTSKDVLVYVKKAYFQAKLDPAFVVRVGAADLPWVPFSEGLYGYRFIENTLIDRTKFGTSADWGVHLGGTFGNNIFSYALSAINGAGYKTLSRSSNTIDLEGRISASPVKNVTLGLGAYSGKLGKSNETNATHHRATRWNAIAAYTDSRIRVGMEYFAAKNWNNITINPAPETIDDKSSGWSAFGSFAFTPTVALFGRYDWVKPSKDLRPALKDHYFNVGLNYKPLKELDLALVYKRDRANNGTISTSNGTIGGADEGTYDEVGIFGQLAF